MMKGKVRGDNPSTDIKGGNLVGMETILVRTGLFNDGLRDFFFKDEEKRTISLWLFTHSDSIL